MVPPWVTASHFLVGNTEAELKPTTISSLLLFRDFLSFLFSWSPSDIVPMSGACWGYSLIINTTPSVPISSNTFLNHWGLIIYPRYLLSTLTIVIDLLNTITLISSTFTFWPTPCCVYLNKMSHHRSGSPHSTRSPSYNTPGNLHFLLSSEDLTRILLCLFHFLIPSRSCEILP